MLIGYPIAMLSPCFANMNEETFKRLPGSTNAVESYNRCSKTEKSDILKVAMMYTYKVDMAAALENLAITQKIATSYTSHSNFNVFLSRILSLMTSQGPHRIMPLM